MTDTNPHRPSRASPDVDDDFSRVYRDQVDRLRRVAYLMTGQAAVAEEIVHDAFLHRTDDGFEYTAPPGLAPTCL